MLKVPFVGNGTIWTDFLKLENFPFGRAKNWTCMITMDLMEGDGRDRTCLGTLLGVW